MTRKLKGLASAAVVVAFLTGAPIAQAATALYPDLKVLPPRDIRLDRTDVTGSDSGATGVRNVLRFSNTVWNAGEGDLLMHGDLNGQSSGPATQIVRDTAGDTLRFPAGSFSYHEAHQHMHYTGWGLYQLWTAADYDAWINQGRPPRTIEQTGAKTTSCILDEEFQQTLPNTRFPATYTFNGCTQDANGDLLEGLSVGWGDTYDYWRHDQWIDLDQATLADGNYVLRTVVDPGNQIRESESGTDPAREATEVNDAIQRFKIQGGKVVDSDPPYGSVTLNDVAASTTSANVSLKVIGRDDVSGINQFRVSNDGAAWSPAYPYTSEGSTPTQMQWNLADPQTGGNADLGRKTVYVQFKDGSGKWGASQTDTIDLVAPVEETPYAAAVRADGPVAHWRLDETSGVIAQDAVGGRHGNYLGSPTLGSPGLLAAPPESGHTAARFDGSDDSVSVPDHTALDLTGAVSLEAWIKPEALPAAGQFAAVVSKEPAYMIQFEGNRIEFAVVQGGAYRRLQADPGLIQVGQTYHVVGTYDGTTQRLYINGVQVESAPRSGPIDTNAVPVTIGAYGSERFKGTIDEVAVYPSALAPARVLAHTDLGRPPPQPPTAPSGTAAAAASSARIDVTWHDNSTTENAFVIERGTSATDPDPQSFNVPHDTTSYADTGLDPATTYWYSVYSRNSNGQSARTPLVSATTHGLAAPSGLTATAASSSRIDLSWTDNSPNETGFVVERATNAQFTGAVALPAVTATALADTGLEPNQRYWYRVRARHTSGNNSPWSAAQDAMTAAAAPLASTSAASGIGETAVTLNGSVNPRGAATAYRFEYRATGAADWVQRPDADAGAGRQDVAVSARLTGLAPATAYEYRLVATNAGGTIASSPAGTFTTTTPAPPSGLTAVAASTTQIDLSWTDNSTSESGFVVERATNDQFTDAVALPSVTGTSTSDTGLEPNRSYWYRVRATYPPSGVTEWSTVASANTNAAGPVATTSAPNPVGETTATLRGTVNPRGAETTYRFEYGTTTAYGTRIPAPDAAVGAGHSERDVSIDLTGLEPGTTYNYRLVARNSFGQQAVTGNRTFTTGAAPPPPAPAHPDPPAGAPDPSQGDPGPPPPDQPSGDPAPPPAPEPLPEPVSPRDLRAPLARLGISAQRLDRVLARGLSLRIASNEPGRVSARLLVAPSALGRRSRQTALPIGRANRRLTRAGKVTLRIRLSSTARRLLARRRSVKLWVETTATDAAGNRAKPVRRAIVLRAKPARARR